MTDVESKEASAVAHFAGLRIVIDDSMQPDTFKLMQPGRAPIRVCVVRRSKKQGRT